MTSPKNEKTPSKVAPSKRQSHDLSSMSSYEPESAFLRRRFQNLEDNGNWWLYAYIVPAVTGLIAVVFWYVSPHFNGGRRVFPGEPFIATTVILVGISAIGLGSVSIWRSETESYRAFQPCFTGVILLLFLVKYFLSIKGH